MARDYTGFASRAFACYFHEHNLQQLSLDEVAKKAEMDPRDLKRIILVPRHEWVGLNLADRIGMTIGLNVCSAVHHGDLEVIPGKGRSDAVKMAEDEFWIHENTPSAEELQARADELRSLRVKVLEDAQNLTIKVEDPVTPDTLSESWLSNWWQKEEV